MGYDPIALAVFCTTSPLFL